jgi:hypothetical protein
MTRFRNLLAAALLWGLAFAPASAWANYLDTPAEDLFITAQQRYGHLEYFGFYASASFGWNFTRELAPFTNLTWIHVGSANDPAGAAVQMVEMLREAREAGVSATLSIEPFLFRDARGNPRTGPEIEAFLVDLRARIENEDLLDSLAMLYPKDEPFRNFRRARNPSFVEQYVTGEVYSDIHADLLFVNDQVKAVFPEIPVGVILSGYEIYHDFFSIPENYDWVGFDCYASLFRACDNRSFVQFYRRLLDHMQPHQRLMAVPETWVTEAGMARADWPDILGQRLLQHYEMALNEPRFVAFIPFIWSFDVDGEPPGPGLNNIPQFFDDGADPRGTDFQEQVIDIGLQVKHGAYVYPDQPWAQTEANPARAPSQVMAEITDISANGTLSAWALDKALPHKNLQVQVEVLDSRGSLLWRSQPERTNVRDFSLESEPRINQDLIGNHGYRREISRKVLESTKGRAVQVRLLVYADGNTQSPAQVSSRIFRPLLVETNPVDRRTRLDAARQGSDTTGLHQALIGRTHADISGLAAAPARQKPCRRPTACHQTCCRRRR